MCRNELCSVAKSCGALCGHTDAVYQASLSSTISWNLLKFMSFDQWCFLNISSSATPFSSYPQSFLASESFPMSGLFTSQSQSIGASVSASVLPLSIQDWFPLGLTGFISLQSKGLFMSLIQHHSLKASILWHSAFFMDQLLHPYMTAGKTIALTVWTFVSKVM